jgi:deoxyribonuclease V
MGAMHACLDVSYDDDPAGGAVTACLLFEAFTDPVEARALVARVADVAPYEPGAFFRRELPCLLAALRLVDDPLTSVVIDGYVWLSDDHRPGLGAHLYEALDRRVPVIGVAKTAFQGSDFAEKVLRGASARPLFVTAAGVSPASAARSVAAMHGEHRIPTLLGRVDRLCRHPDAPLPAR